MENLVKDPYFTSGLWKIASKPEEVKISSEKVQTSIGVKDSLKIESFGWSEWRLVYGEKLQVKSRETYRLNVRMMLNLEDRKASVVLEPQILDENSEKGNGLHIDLKSAQSDLSLTLPRKKPILT